MIFKGPFELELVSFKHLILYHKLKCLKEYKNDNLQNN